MGDIDMRYFMHRAEVEITRAERATEPCVAQVHYQLADAYLAKLHPTDLERENAAP
jgi:hypothetical protein